MTRPFEQTRAVVCTREFLCNLVDPVATPDIPVKVRRHSIQPLRHYPSLADMDIAHRACPQWFDAPGETRKG